MMRRRDAGVTERHFKSNTFIYIYDSKYLVRLSGTEPRAWDLIGRFESLGGFLQSTEQGDGGTEGPGPKEKAVLVGKLWKAKALELDEGDIRDLAGWILRFTLEDLTGQEGGSPGNPAAGRDAWQTLWDDAEGSGRVVRCHLELTYRCNLRCRHCYNPEIPQTELDTAEMKRIIAQLRDRGCLFITFTGGEPFVRRDFPELLRYARESGLVASVSTNGSLVTRAKAELLRDFDLLSVDVSLYGLSREAYARVTGNGAAYAQVLAGIEALRDAGVNVFVKFIVTRDTWRDAPSFGRLLDSLSVQGIVHWPRLFPRQDGGRFPLTLRLTDEELSELLAGGVLKPPARKGRCFAGSTRLRISPEGKLYPCEFLPIELGDLRAEPLGDVLRQHFENNSVFSRNPRLFSPAECDGCGVKAFCYRCPALAFAETGNLETASSEACRVAHLVAPASRG